MEDDASIADMYQRGLRWAGYDVAVFATAAAFLDELDNQVPDVLVLDWMLPGIAGADLLRHLREGTRTRDLRVVILSSLSEGGGREMDVAFAYGALAWMEKWKTTPALLAERIREALPTGAA